MMTQPAASTGGAPNAGPGAEAAGTAAATPAAANVFSQALQALTAGAGIAVTPVPGGDVSAAGLGTDPLAAEPLAVNPAGTGGAGKGAVTLPDGWLQSATAPVATADDSGSSAARTRADSTQQATTTGAAVPGIAKDLLRLLFAKHPVLLTTAGAAQDVVAEAGDEHAAGSADKADDSAGAATGLIDQTAAAATLLVQVPMQAPTTAALKWQQPSDAKSTRGSVAAPTSATTSDPTVSGASSATDLHQAIAAALTPAQGASSIASLIGPQGSAADAPRLPRLVADAGASMDASGMAAALRVTNATNAAPLEHTVAVPVHDRHWPTAMAAQVLILSGDKVRAATLRLTPEHLGPLEVRIDMQDSSVNVSFTAAHAETRSALEQAMPQLRSVLAGAGLTLGQATVQQQARHGSQNPNTMLRGGTGADEMIEAPVSVWRALGLIDEYA